MCVLGIESFFFVTQKFSLFLLLHAEEDEERVESSSVSSCRRKEGNPSRGRSFRSPSPPFFLKRKVGGWIEYGNVVQKLVSNGKHGEEREREKREIPNLSLSLSPAYSQLLFSQVEVKSFLCPSPLSLHTTTFPHLSLSLSLAKVIPSSLTLGH